jgi:Ser/Thr protein kinase RdoA (MazF antagonist)
MTHGVNTDRLPAHRSELQLQLENRLADHFGRRRAIVSLERRLCPYTSTFTIEEIDVAFADGSALRLVMKDLSPEAMADSVRRARPEFLYEPRREIQAYRWILPYAPPGTAIWYGAVANPSTRRYRLFLERVEGLELRHVGAFSIWERAARWIARFHRGFRSFPSAGLTQLVESARLLVYDEAFYWRWLERAQQFAAGRPAVRRVIDRIARRYPPIVRRLASLPRTLIHGELYPCNILIRRTGRQVRVCPIDWEMAALGPGLMDLASLTTGWHQRQQRALIRAYRAAAPDAAARSARIPHDFWVDLECCRLHLAVRMLGWSETWAPPPQHARDWLADAASLAERLQALT